MFCVEVRRIEYFRSVVPYFKQYYKVDKRSFTHTKHGVSVYANVFKTRIVVY